MTRDSQRAALYRWERELPQWTERGSMSLRDCTALITHVWADYRPGASIPLVADGRGTRSATGARYRISLPRWARSRLVVLHETAHSLTRYGAEPHGPEFARLMLDLFAHYGGVDRAVAIRAGEAQRPRCVHFAPAARVPQPARVRRAA